MHSIDIKKDSLYCIVEFLYLSAQESTYVFYIFYMYLCFQGNTIKFLHKGQSSKRISPWVADCLPSGDPSAYCPPFHKRKKIIKLVKNNSFI